MAGGCGLTDCVAATSLPPSGVAPSGRASMKRCHADRDFRPLGVDQCLISAGVDDRSGCQSQADEASVSIGKSVEFAGKAARERPMARSPPFCPSHHSGGHACRWTRSSPVRHYIRQKPLPAAGPTPRLYVSGQTDCSRLPNVHNARSPQSTPLPGASAREAVEDATVIHPGHAARLVREQRLGKGPFPICRFIPPCDQAVQI